MGICAFCYIWNLIGIMVFQRSMVNWRREGGVNLLWVMVFQRSMLDWRRGGWGQSAMGICAFCYLWQLFDVVVLHRYMLYWRRGVGGQSAMGICAFCYIWNLFWCNRFPEMYSQLEEGVRSICHAYLCILLYLKLIWCSGVALICAWWGVHLTEVYVNFMICKTALV